MPEQAQAPAPSPEKIWNALNGFQKTATLKAAIELDLFTAIGEGFDTADVLAARLSASPRGVRILCDYLTVEGFLAKNGGKYSLPLESQLFLDRRSPACMGSVVHFLTNPQHMSAFTDVAKLVRTGTTILPTGASTEPEYPGWEVFAESMVPMIASAVQFIGELAVANGQHPKRVLDIAAGHGLFGIEIAKRAPHAEIVAVDWPKVLQIAQRNARNAGVEGRYKALSGDAFAVQFGTGFDLVLLTNFLHHFDEQTCVKLLKKIYAATEPRSRLITLEFVPNDDRVSPPIAAQFSMMMLAATPQGDAYTAKQLDSMAKAAGFGESQFLQVPRSPQHVMVTSRD